MFMFANLLIANIGKTHDSQLIDKKCSTVCNLLLLVLLEKKLKLDALQDDTTIVLNVSLDCEQTKSSETKQVHFKSLPTTPLEIKKKIEEDFSIPSCIQTLRYQSMILKDSDQLQDTHLRSGDTFTVDYPMEADCKMIQNVIKWLKELHELLKSIEENISFPDEENDLLMSSNVRKIEDLILVGEKDGIIEALAYTLFSTRKDKKLMNRFYFQWEGGLDMLMKVYGILISKKWGDVGIEENFHIHLENVCSTAVCNFSTLQFQRQVIQLGGLEMCTTALLRKRVGGDESTLTPRIYETLDSALTALLK